MKLRITWSNGDIDFRYCEPEFVAYFRDLVKNKDFSFERMIECDNDLIINLKHARSIDLVEDE